MSAAIQIWDRSADWRDRAIRLLSVYNKCLARVVGNPEAAARYRRAKPKSPTPANYEMFHEIDLFCERNDLDGPTWVFACFSALSWKLPASTRILTNIRYRKTYDQLYSSRVRDVDNMVISLASKGGALDPIEDIYPASEEIKRRYQIEGRSDRCLRSFDITFGFKAGSEICRSCPRADECRDLSARIKSRIR